jgi:electron transfer flavoprotein beta subunit
MKILVCIKQVPSTSEVEVDEKTGVLKREGVDSKINPYDLYALETAVRIKERKSAEVTVMTMGPPQAKEIIKEAYMMGADKGIILTDRKFAGADVLATAHTLSEGIIKSGVPDLIICGKQTTDGDTAQVGPEIAEFLNIPHAAYVNKILKIKEDSVTVEMEMEHSIETAEIKLPCLITVDKGVGQPRLPSFTLKLKTQYREIPIYTIKDFKSQNEKQYGLNGSPTQVIKVFPPKHNTDHVLWDGNSEKSAKQLSDKLIEMKFI